MPEHSAPALEQHDQEQSLESTPLDKLRALTPRLSELELAPKGVSFVDLSQPGCGTVFGFGLWKNRVSAGQKAYFAAGASFPDHAHVGKEWLIILDGGGTLTIDNRSFELLPGDEAILEPGQVHTFIADCETWMIGIIYTTDPGELEGWPDGPC